MLLSNSVIYDHKLQSGSDAVATATLHIPHWSSTIASEGEGTDGSSVEAMKTELPRWLLRAVDPSHPVVFINTDKVGKGWKAGKQKMHCSTVLILFSTCLSPVFFLLTS